MSNELRGYVNKYFTLIEASALGESGENCGNKIFVMERMKEQIEVPQATSCRLPRRLFANGDRKTIRLVAYAHMAVLCPM